MWGVWPTPLFSHLLQAGGAAGLMWRFAGLKSVQGLPAGWGGGQLDGYAPVSAMHGAAACVFPRRPPAPCSMEIHFSGVAPSALRARPGQTQWGLLWCAEMPTYPPSQGSVFRYLAPSWGPWALGRLQSRSQLCAPPRLSVFGHSPVLVPARCCHPTGLILGSFHLARLPL